MRTLAIKLGAILCILLGLATVWLPIPTGLILIALGICLLLMTSPQVVGWVRRLRERYPGLDRRLRRVEPLLPEKMRQALARSRAWAAGRKRRPAPQVPTDLR